jgi:hypothetical protein
MGTLYAWIVSLFGAPFAIAERLILVRKTRRDILQWLGPIEALARRLLLLKALTLPKPNCPPAKVWAGRLLIAFADRPQAEIDPNAETWRVRFCVMPQGALRRKSRGDAPADKRAGGHVLNALPLARRIEALRRVLENPAPALARLARLLATQREVIVAAFKPYRPRATCVQSLLMETQRQVDLALNTS